MRSPLNLKSALIVMCLSVATAWHVHASAFTLENNNDVKPSGSSESKYAQGQNILVEDLSERFGVHVTILPVTFLKGS